MVLLWRDIEITKEVTMRRFTVYLDDTRQSRSASSVGHEGGVAGASAAQVIYQLCGLQSLVLESFDSEYSDDARHVFPVEVLCQSSVKNLTSLRAYDTHFATLEDDRYLRSLTPSFNLKILQCADTFFILTSLVNGRRPKTVKLTTFLRKQKLRKLIYHCGDEDKEEDSPILPKFLKAMRETLEDLVITSVDNLDWVVPPLVDAEHLTSIDIELSSIPDMVKFLNQISPSTQFFTLRHIWKDEDEPAEEVKMLAEALSSVSEDWSARGLRALTIQTWSALDREKHWSSILKAFSRRGVTLMNISGWDLYHNDDIKDVGGQIVWQEEKQENQRHQESFVDSKEEDDDLWD